MLRKIVVLSGFFLSVILTSSPTWAQCPTPDGNYRLGGKLSGKANFPSLVTLSLKLPDLIRTGAIALFDPSGEFSLFLPLLSQDPLLTGSWTMVPSVGCPTGFTVDLGMESLVEELASYGIQATITNRSFGGTLQGDGSIKGTLNLVVSIAMPFISSGTISMKSSFTGTPVPTAPLSLSVTAPLEEGGSRGSSVLADLILKFLQKIPVQ